MNYLLDTNFIIEVATNSPEAVHTLKEICSSSWAGYSAITRLELFSYPNLTADEENALNALCVEFEEYAVNALVIDRAILLRKTSKIKTPDALIAATALCCKATLVTRNISDFHRIPDLKIWNPWGDPPS